MSNADRLREPIARPPNPSSYMMSPHRPARMITSSMLIIRLKPTFKKNQAAGKTVSYDRICPSSQLHLQKSILTTKSASVIWMVIGPFN